LTQFLVAVLTPASCYDLVVTYSSGLQRLLLAAWVLVVTASLPPLSDSLTLERVIAWAAHVVLTWQAIVAWAGAMPRQRH
jgi:uncharacterized membrane protein YjdF